MYQSLNAPEGERTRSCMHQTLNASAPDCILPQNASVPECTLLVATPSSSETFMASCQDRKSELRQMNHLHHPNILGCLFFFFPDRLSVKVLEKYKSGNKIVLRKIKPKKASVHSSSSSSTGSGEVLNSRGPSDGSGGPAGAEGGRAGGEKCFLLLTLRAPPQQV